MKTSWRFTAENKGRLHLAFSAAILCLLFAGMYLLYVSGFRFSSWASAVIDCFFFLFCIYTGRWLCSIYLKRGLLMFTLFFVTTVAGLSALKFVLVKFAFNHPGAGFLELFRDVMPFFLIGLVMGMLLKFVRASVQKELSDAHMQTEQKAMEFSLLQSQLSPHFLFNVLNNLYGISLEEHERIPPLLLKLSGLLRYAVYGAKKKFVPLQEELDYIRHYIEFEKIRISDRLIIETDIPGMIDPGIKIAPLVLIVFVENAFKHAKNSLGENIYINICLKISGGLILFTVVNSYCKEEKQDDRVGESSGLGLANTIKRLELLYGPAHKLKQRAYDGRYIIELALNYAA